MRFLRSKKTSAQSDEALLEEYRRTGERSVMETLFDRYCHLAFAVCMKYLKNEEDSKDAVLHIFERMHADLAKYRVERFSHWLYVLTRNYCLKELKSRKPLAAVEELPDTVEEAPENDFTPELLGRLGEALSSLNEGQRVCIRLFYLEEKTYQEIAGQTGYDLKQVKSYIQNGKRNLRKYLTRDEA
jgi:RNA polymerase sigma-70 factor (ECF subfamily)